MMVRASFAAARPPSSASLAVASAAATSPGASHPGRKMNAFGILAAIFLLGLPPALAANPPAAKPTSPNQQLDALFVSLAKVNSPEEAKPIEEQIEQMFLLSNSPTIGLLMTRAAAALQGGDTDTAKKLLNYVTDLAPDYAEGWHQLGRLQAGANDDVHALISLQKTVTLNPREFEAEVELGEMLISYNQKPAALAMYRKALALDPHFEGLDKRVDQLAREVEGEKI